MERRILGLRLRQIDAEASFQTRAEVPEDTAQDYAYWMQEDDREPSPIVVFGSREPYYIGDGFIRYRAHELAGRKTIMCDVRPGGRREAAFFAIATNIANAERPGIDDRKYWARQLLLDPDLLSDPVCRRKLSHREIATLCRLGRKTVDRLAEMIEEGKEQGQDRGEVGQMSQLSDNLTKADRWIARRNTAFDALPLTPAERAAIDQATAELGAVWAPILARLSGTTGATAGR